MNEFDPLEVVAIRTARAAFLSQDKARQEWQALRFHAEPDVAEAIREYDMFRDHLAACGAQVIELPGASDLTLDAIYTRDALIVSPDGLILCNPGRASRRPEAKVNAGALNAMGFDVAGTINGPGTLEGGDFIWLSRKAAAVGLGPRTNSEGIRQLQAILGAHVDLHTVPLPAPEHPDDVFHLMSMISPLDKDLALIYRPLMPTPFIDCSRIRELVLLKCRKKSSCSWAATFWRLGPAVF